MGAGDGGRGDGGREILGAGVIPKFVVFYRFLCTSVQYQKYIIDVLK